MSTPRDISCCTLFLSWASLFYLTITLVVAGVVYLSWFFCPALCGHTSYTSCLHASCVPTCLECCLLALCRAFSSLLVVLLSSPTPNTTLCGGLLDYDCRWPQVLRGSWETCSETPSCFHHRCTLLSPFWAWPRIFMVQWVIPRCLAGAWGVHFRHTIVMRRPFTCSSVGDGIELPGFHFMTMLFESQYIIWKWLCVCFDLV